MWSSNSSNVLRTAHAPSCSATFKELRDGCDKIGHVDGLALVPARRPVANFAASLARERPQQPPPARAALDLRPLDRRGKSPAESSTSNFRQRPQPSVA